ncbi:hypothetical protein [Erythrobacter aureus]|uniref:Uncharacterized protein n=1 Tax=Erythrobacter aureus TaxID=2182384 RepID=A0A345YJ52_9SPHN|nr:hypothetical protein [Erythrobacter aureus]AXK43954.1 hypothetical protein DVR09_15990 [Erythrobacter aureus]
MYAFAYDGTPIKGTLETLPGTARITEDSFKANPEGMLEYEHQGGTDIDYDGQETVERDGKKMYVDEDGDAWPENEIVLHERSDISTEELAHLKKSSQPIVVLSEGISERILYEIFNLDWDTSGDDDDGTPGEPDLPLSVVVSVDPDDDEFADMLSDRYGFCINSYSIQRLDPVAA